MCGISEILVASDSISTMLTVGVASCVLVVLLMGLATVYSMWLTKTRHDRWIENNPKEQEDG
jgi:hypothetical protein